ncbi:hypothetical protein Nepgr_017460 [Nepenthes gracilis]|uniref:Uncharacterized protein n=1 Tax=Nepenthes gracilis TaxID=150966 RepID=A0AAD3SRM2_NEPGR|nr:hypothetical protein Nepgr_017460 [Nepenthes gracilis]
MLEVLDSNGSLAAAWWNWLFAGFAFSWCCFAGCPNTRMTPGCEMQLVSCLLRRGAWILFLLGVEGGAAGRMWMFWGCIELLKERPQQHPIMNAGQRPHSSSARELTGAAAHPHQKSIATQRRLVAETRQATPKIQPPAPGCSKPPIIINASSATAYRGRPASTTTQIAIRQNHQPNRDGQNTHRHLALHYQNAGPINATK